MAYDFPKKGHYIPDVPGDSMPQKGEPDEAIEITPEMIEAGRRVLHESGLLPEGQEGTASEIVVVTEVFCSMMGSRAKR